MYAQPIVGGNDDAPSRTVQQFNTISGQNDMAWSGTEDDAQLIVPVPGRFGYLQTSLYSATPGAGKQYALTVRKAGVDTNLSAVIANTSNLSQDFTHFPHFNAGDKISLGCTPTGSPNAAQMLWSCAFFPDDGQSFIFMTSSLDLVIGANNFLPPHGGNQAGDANENSCYLIAPHSFEIMDMYVELNNAPGGVASRTATLIENNVASGSGFVTVSGANKTGNLSGTGVVMSEDGLLTIKQTVSGSPATSKMKVSLSYVPTTPGLFVCAGSTFDDLALSTTIVYNYPFLGSGVWFSGVNTPGPYIGIPFIFNKLKTRWDTAPGVGNSRTMEILRFGSSLSSPFKTTVSGTNKIGTYTSAYYPGADQRPNLIMKTGLTGTPATSKVSWSVSGQCLLPFPFNKGV